MLHDIDALHIDYAIVSKYADDLPLYRQAQFYARQGVNLDRSTLADWGGKAPDAGARGGRAD